MIVQARPFTFSETKNQINKPTNKWNKGKHSPRRFLTNTSEIFECNIDNGQHGKYVKEKADFYPGDDGGGIQCYPFKSLETLSTVLAYGRL